MLLGQWNTLNNALKTFPNNILFWSQKWVTSVLGHKCPWSQKGGHKCPSHKCPGHKCPGHKCPSHKCPRTRISAQKLHLCESGLRTHSFRPFQLLLFLFSVSFSTVLQFGNWILDFLKCVGKASESVREEEK